MFCNHGLEKGLSKQECKSVLHGLLKPAYKTAALNCAKGCVEIFSLVWAVLFFFILLFFIFFSYIVGNHINNQHLLSAQCSGEKIGCYPGMNTYGIFREKQCSVLVSV